MDIEETREYKRNWAKKNYHKNREKMRSYYDRYWENTTPERKEKRRQQKIKDAERWRKMHPDTPQVYYRKNLEKWTNGIKCLNPKVWKTAEQKAKKLIIKLGYKNIFQPNFKFFYFDFLSKNGSQYTCFQVTTLRARSIKRKHIELANYLNWDFYVIHVKPNLTEAYITKVNPIIPNKNKDVVCYYYTKGIKYALT